MVRWVEWSEQLRNDSGAGRGPPPGQSLSSPDQLLIEVATLLNFCEALPPSRVTAAMQTTAMRATRRAYSTSEAPRSSSVRLRSQVARNSNDVIMVDGAPLTGRPRRPGEAELL